MMVRLWRERQKSVGHGLRLHALARVHHQQGTFTRGKRPRNFIGKIHVAGGINQVQLVFLAVRAV